MEHSLTKFDIGIFTKDIGETRLSHVTGDEIIERYLRKLESENTQIAYRRSIYTFFNWMYDRDTYGNLRADELVVDPIDADDYHDLIKEKLDSGEIKMSTFNQKIKGIRSFYKWLVHQTTSNRAGVRVFTSNPFEEIETHSEHDKFGARPLTDEEVIRMLNEPYGETPHLQERNKLLLELGVSTSIRCEALATLKPSNVMIFEGTKIIYVVDKGKKEFRKAITPYYDRLLEWYRKDKMIRTSDNGTIFNLHPDSASRIIRLWARARGIDKKISFHSLRTTGIIGVYHKTGSYERTQDYAGHSNSSTTKEYVDKENLVNFDGEYLVEEMMRNGISKLQEVLETMDKDKLIYLIMTSQEDIKMRIANRLIDSLNR